MHKLLFLVLSAVLTSISAAMPLFSEGAKPMIPAAIASLIGGVCTAIAAILQREGKKDELTVEVPKK